MRWEKALLAAVILLFLLLGAGVAFLLFKGTNPLVKPPAPSFYEVIEKGKAGEYGYLVISYRGKGNITLLALKEMPKKRVVVFDYEEAVGERVANSIYQKLLPLKEYGYEVEITNQTAIGEDIYIIPTGAMPSRILFNIRNNENFYLKPNHIIM